MKKRPAIDDTMSRLIKEAADEAGILKSQGEDIYLFFMQDGMKQLRSDDPKPWIIPHLGKFFISPLKTARAIERMFMSMRKRQRGDDPEGMTREEVADRLRTTYWPLHNKARQHAPRIGELYRLRKYFEKKRHERTEGHNDHHADHPGL